MGENGEASRVFLSVPIRVIRGSMNRRQSGKNSCGPQLTASGEKLRISGSPQFAAKIVVS